MEDTAGLDLIMGGLAIAIFVGGLILLLKGVLSIR
jgi:hypothetical protein